MWRSGPRGRLEADRRFAVWTTFYKSCTARIVSDLDSHGINYGQKVRDFLSEPESPSHSRKFSYPESPVRCPRRPKAASGLCVALNIVSLVVREDDHFGDGFARHRFDAENFDRETDFIGGDGKLRIGCGPNAIHRICIGPCWK
jgi:hypothetical protein